MILRGDRRLPAHLPTCAILCCPRSIPAILLLYVACALFVAMLSACRSGGSGKSQVAAAPAFEFGTPILTSISPAEGCCGDMIEIAGYNFAPTVSGNRVVFSDATGLVEIPGEIVEVLATGDDSDLFGAATTLIVAVPTGVRSGSVKLVVSTPTAVVHAGAAAFAACPQLLGFAIREDGAQGNLVVLENGGFLTDSIAFYGYNTELLTAAAIADPSDDVIPLGAPAPFTPPSDGWMIPSGASAVSVLLDQAVAPPDLPIDGCDEGSFPLSFRLTATYPSGATYKLPAVEVQMAFADVATVPATITGALIPAGVRAGDLTIRYTLYAEPANTRYDCIPEFFDPAQAKWIECASAITGVGNGNNVVPAGRAWKSTIGALVGPGSMQSFVWNTRASSGGLPFGRMVTRLRFGAKDPEENNVIDCPTTTWLTGPIVINNTAAPAGLVREDFDSSLRLDPEFAGSAQLAPEGGGLLIGAGAPQDIFGAGIAHIVLEAGADYTIDTDAGTIIQNDLGDPLDLFPEGNPGAALDTPEFHVATIQIEDGAAISVQGSSPLVFRCSGTGDDLQVVARIDGAIRLDGKDGTQGSPNAVGIGGAGGPGGFRGGDGGAVITDGGTPGKIAAVIVAGDGEGPAGAGAGSAIVLVSPGVDVANPRAGPGGGAGHRTAGGNGVLLIGASVIQAPVGRGGDMQGDDEITILSGGSGGGGGSPFRGADGDPLISKYGGGGGGGGGAFRVIADGSIAIVGTITTNGGIGEKGTTGGGAAPGGGGSGGSILLQATGTVAVDAGGRLLALGAEGGRVGSIVRGGTGAAGRIRIEAQLGIEAPGIVDFSGVQGGSPDGVSIGIAPDPADGGSGEDGYFDLSHLSGPLIADTDSGDISGPDGILLLGDGDGDGEYHFSNFILPASVTLRGVGSKPLVIRVSGDADVAGTIEVSGAAGGQVDVTGPLSIVGTGGAGGPSGGAGGSGGYSDGVTMVDGASGGLPPELPPDLVAALPPLGTPGDDGTLISQSVVAATGGESREEICSLPSLCYPGHGGGGGYATAGEDAEPATNGTVSTGTGGSPFGTAFLSHPLSGEPLQVGGTGGGGGGGGGNPDSVFLGVPTPGTGGGGAGGYFQLAVTGFLTIRASARICADGGDAYRASLYGGNAGAGAGGAIKIQGNVFVAFASTEVGSAPIITAFGGVANLQPTADFDGDGIVDYTGNTLSSAGGNGAPGRIRIESLAGFAAIAQTACGAATVLYTDPLGIPAAGICPGASFGRFALAKQIQSEARTLPLQVVGGDGVRHSGSQFGVPAVVTAPRLLPENTRVKVLYEGARESLDVSGTPGPFFGLVDDPLKIDSADFLRMHFVLYADAIGGGVPAIDLVELPIEFVEP